LADQTAGSKKTKRELKNEKLLLISWLAAGLLLTGLAYAADKTEALLDLLVEKGIVTKDEAAGLRADLAVKEQDEKSQKKEFNITAGKLIKLSGYTQVRYRNGGDINDTFDIRRARLSIYGISPSDLIIRRRLNLAERQVLFC